MDLSSLGITAPSATWTYLVNHDPFKDQLTMVLTGVGGASVAIYAAAVMAPLLVTWGLVDRFVRTHASPVALLPPPAMTAAAGKVPVQASGPRV